MGRGENTVGRIRRWSVTLTAVALAWTLAGVAGAQQAPGAPQPPEVAEVLELAGIDAALEQIPGLVMAQIESRRADMPPGVAGKLEHAMLEAFKPALLKADARAALGGMYEPGLFAQGLVWLRAPLGKRITQFEVDAGKDENQEALGAWVENLMQNAPPKDRIILVADVVRSTDTLATVIDMIVLVAEPIVQTLNALEPVEKQRSQDAIRTVLTSMRNSLEQPMGRQLLVRGMYTYRELSDAEIVSYIQFLRSPAGQGLYKGLNASMLAAIEQAGARFADGFEAVIAP